MFAENATFEETNSRSGNIRTLNVDSMIHELRQCQLFRPGTNAKLNFDDIHSLLAKSRTIFISQPMLLEIKAPLNICGDLHGQYYDLLRLFDIGLFPPQANYLFLGDYVDRADQSIETVCLLLCYKVKYPNNFFMLRGNHESSSINRIYGFYDECKRRYNVRLWKMFCDLFNTLPVAALVDDRIFCMHGGLSQELLDFNEINQLRRPTEIHDEGLLCDLLWADPDPNIVGYRESDRGVSFSFGPDVIRKFCARNSIDLICRAHQVVEDGYEFCAERKLVTIFSAPNYCGEFDNAAGMMTVDENLMCSFHVLKPKPVSKSPTISRSKNSSNYPTTSEN